MKAEGYVELAPALYLASPVLQNASLDPAEVQRLREEMEAKARTELNKKLEDVNAYLEQQARERQRIDALRDQNEGQLRAECDRTRRELMVRGQAVGQRGWMGRDGVR
jgi:hypothetical protein